MLLLLGEHRPHSVNVEWWAFYEAGGLSAFDEEPLHEDCFNFLNSLSSIGLHHSCSRVGGWDGVPSYISFQSPSRLPFQGIDTFGTCTVEG